MNRVGVLVYVSYLFLSIKILRSTDFVSAIVLAHTQPTPPRPQINTYVPYYSYFTFFLYSSYVRFEI